MSKRHFVMYIPGAHVTVWNAKDSQHARTRVEETTGEPVVRVRELHDGNESPEGLLLDLASE